MLQLSQLPWGALAFLCHAYPLLSWFSTWWMPWLTCIRLYFYQLLPLFYRPGSDCCLISGRIHRAGHSHMTCCIFTKINLLASNLIRLYSTFAREECPTASRGSVATLSHRAASVVVQSSNRFCHSCEPLEKSED